MMMCRAAFRDQQIIISIDFVYMRRFCPHRAFDSAIPEYIFLTDQLHFLEIEFLKTDFGMPCVIARFVAGDCR